MVILKNNHKNIGNNISNKTLEECEQYIFNINSYKATAEITVQSNKNINKYLVKQEVNSNESYQEIIEPENIKGVKIIYSNNNNSRSKEGLRPSFSLLRSRTFAQNIKV